MAENKVADGVLFKIKRDEIAISAELKRYRAIELTKNGQSKNTSKFIEMIKYLNVLLFSHCKNTIAITPELAITQVKELSSLLEDLVSKYQDLNAKYINRIAINPVEDTKTYQTSQLCSLCSQTIKKTEIEYIKSHIFHNNSLHTHNYDDEDYNRQEGEDHLFFAQVNNLLANKQADIVKNQKKLRNFHQTAMESLDALLEIQKDFVNIGKIPEHNINWHQEAKRQMQSILQDYFSGKIPPWITKMLYLFTNLHYRSKFDKQREVEVQTDITTNNQIIELKKKNIMSVRKLQYVQNISKQQQKDLINLQTQCEHLQTKVDYYKEQINRLIQEIDFLKDQNQSMQKKLLNLNNLNKSRKSRRINDSESQGNQNSTIDFTTQRSIRKRSILENDSASKIFPKVKIRKDQKLNRRYKYESRTSIKVTQLSQHKKQGKNSSNISKSRKKISNLSRRSSQQQDLKTTNRSVYSRKSQKNQKQIKQSSEVILKDQKSILHGDIKEISMKNVIPELQGESNLEDERIKVKMVSDKLKEVIKHGINQTQRHKKFRSSMPLPGLKKVPHKTHHQDNQTKQNAHLQLNKFNSYNKKNGGQITPSEAFQHHQNNKIASIYKQLKQKGYLIKISEDQFKMVIKIKAFNFGSKDLSLGSSVDSATFTRYADRSKKTKRLKSTSRQINKLLNIEDYYKTARPSQYSRSQCLPGQNSKQKDYSALFTNELNAYKYENSFHKSTHKKIYTPTKIEEKLSKELFQHLNKLKQSDQDQYRHICSYIRYPFQVMQNNLGILSINQLKEGTFSVCFQRIAALHSKCKKQDGLCVHLAKIRQKIVKNSQLNQTI